MIEAAFAASLAATGIAGLEGGWSKRPNGDLLFEATMRAHHAGGITDTQAAAAEDLCRAIGMVLIGQSISGGSRRGLLPAPPTTVRATCRPTR